MIDPDKFKVKYDKQWDNHIIAYTHWWPRYWLIFKEDFNEIANMLLKCNNDIKEIKAKLNRMLWISNTRIWELLWITNKRNLLLDNKDNVELQMYMITESVHIHNKKLFNKLEKDPLTIKLFTNE